MKKNSTPKINCGKRWALGVVFLLGALVCAPMFANAQAGADRTVKGTVTDQEGAPVAGATIIVNGTNVATTSDVSGAFSIRIPAGKDQLDVNYLGYEQQSVLVGNRSELQIALTASAQTIDDVVVVGYGTAKKETLTGSIAVVGDKAMRDKGSLSSPLQALQGQVPGLTITRNSGAPGDEGWNMSMRGAVSVNATDPLIIIDGVKSESPGEMRMLNPADIQSMSFLKDASAAIYGSRAAGGVVLITTKKATQGEAKIEYNGSYSLKSVGLQPHLMSFDQWTEGVITARQNDGFGDDDVWIRYARLAQANKNRYIDLSQTANPIPGAFTDVADFVFMEDVNWSDVLWENASSTQHDISVSGGGNNMTYRISTGYMYDQGTLAWGTNKNQRYNLRSYNKLQVTKRFSIESVIAYNRQDQTTPSRISWVLTKSVPQPGLPMATIDGKPYMWGGQRTPNWVAELGGDNVLKVSTINVSETLKYDFTDKLSLTAVLGYNNNNATRDRRENAMTWYAYDGKTINRVDPTQANSAYEKTNSRTDYYSVSSYLSYNTTFGKLHNFSAIGGYEYNLHEYESSGLRVLDIQSTLDAVNGSGVISMRNAANGESRGIRDHEAMASFYARANYDYKSKYLLEVNARYDGTSKFQPENRWDFFYGFSAGWRITEEAFMKNVNWLNELKLRASYGVVGNQSGVDKYDGVQLYNFFSNSGPYIGGGKQSYIDTNGKLLSTDRRWERIQNYNVALDFGLLGDKLTGTVEYFVKNNNNMLLEQQLPGIVGDRAPFQNIGKLKSYGFEISANWRHTVGQVSYYVGGVFSFARNNLTDILGTSVKTLGFNSRVQGYPLNSVFGLRYAGKIQTEEQRRAYLGMFYEGNGIGMPAENLLRLGDNMYQDINGDYDLDYEDYVYLGTDTPEVTFSLNLGASWKGFDLSAVFQGATMRTIFRDDVHWRIPFNAVYLNTTDHSWGKTWSPETPDNRYPAYSTDGTINGYNYQASSWSAEDGTYLRLKNLTLGYTIPDSIMKKAKGIGSFRVYLTGYDIWEYTKIHDGWDPEASRGVQENSMERYPFNRVYTVGVNLTF